MVQYKVDLTIQSYLVWPPKYVKAIERNFLIVLFETLESVDEIRSISIQMKAADEYISNA